MTFLIFKIGLMTLLAQPVFILRENLEGCYEMLNYFVPIFRAFF